MIKSNPDEAATNDLNCNLKQNPRTVGRFLYLTIIHPLSFHPDLEYPDSISSREVRPTTHFHKKY